ncbi:MAG: type II toxin-antitoxin system PemK/MazF family toxin [Candidatus Peregrinibacteria bacterium]|nr:type II toxin-antitoxin system PemK/MazF family toxin [Candidatus Peregrinibacteria bacterium]MDZ4244865.1 type II toxin-antitoxin system PemK/MazF family toxin [Candidatus Gracilibacteria bacterium]
MNIIKYGDILLVDFNPVKGREVSKIRPAIVISNAFINEESPYLIVVSLSSQVSRVLAFQFIVEKSKVNGLDVNSKVMPETVRSIDKVRVVKKIGHLEDRYIELLEGKIL